MNTETIIGIISVAANIGVAWWSIWTNRKIELENAGKNRTIYQIEEVKVNTGSATGFNNLNEKLNSGKYTVMNVIQDSGGCNNRIYTWGKIKV